MLVDYISLNVLYLLSKGFINIFFLFVFPGCSHNRYG